MVFITFILTVAEMQLFLLYLKFYNHLITLYWGFIILNRQFLFIRKPTFIISLMVLLFI
jgi:hypothetical protein